MSTGGRPAPRLRAVVRRRAQLRHPDHGRRRRRTARCGCASTTPSESDRVRYPLGRDTRIEGGRGSDGDKHAIVVDKGDVQALRDLEHRESATAAGAPAPGAVWSCAATRCGPNGWTSADAAGLPILPGPAAVERGAQPAASTTRSGSPPTSPPRRHLWPARHDAGLARQPAAYPPMGARFRLKAGFSTARLLGRTPGEVIRAMKTYGLVLADNGSPWFFQGEQQRGAGPTRLIEDLKRIPASRLRRRRHLLAEGRPAQRRGALTAAVAAAPRSPGFRTGVRAAVVFTRPSGGVHPGGIRAVAQLGSALDWGSRGRRFKSCQPDACDVSRHPGRPDLRKQVRACVVSGSSRSRRIFRFPR